MSEGELPKTFYFPTPAKIGFVQKTDADFDFETQTFTPKKEEVVWVDEIGGDKPVEIAPLEDISTDDKPLNLKTFEISFSVLKRDEDK